MRDILEVLAEVSEHQALEEALSGGQEGDAPVGAELLGEVLAYEEIQAVSGDRAYDSNAIRGRSLLCV